MGREIRRVPPNWEHPRDDAGKYRPMFDETWADAFEEWLQEYREWEAGTHKDFAKHGEKYTFCEWHGSPPDAETYRPAFTEEPTWFQVYETVSEGTPITPPFPSKEALVEFLCTEKDFLGYGPRTRPAAEAFVEAGWVPSMMMVSDSGGTSIYSDMDIAEQLKKDTA